MKHIIKFIIIFAIVALILAVLVEIKPNLSRTCKLGEYDITFKIPYAYETTTSQNENTLLSLYNVDKEIAIEAVHVKDDFWSENDIDSRMKEYMTVLISANYEAQINNVKTEILEVNGKQLGKVECELEYPDQIRKSITLITSLEDGNNVVEIISTKEKMDENIQEIEEIISTIKI